MVLSQWSNGYAHRLLAIIAAMFLVAVLGGCGGPSAEQLAAVDYTPSSKGAWPISTPAEQGLDAELVARLYYNASQLKSIYSLLLFKNEYLIAEEYFHIGAPEQQVNIHSVTKSINAALVGIALDQGYLSSLDQKMMEFFPELANRAPDPRLKQITIRQLLQMRAGYPWEESTSELFELLFSGFRASTLVEVPLVRDPGSDFEYSNLTAHILGLIVARATGSDLRTFAQENLFAPLGIETGFWQVDWDGNYLGFSDIHLTAHDMAKFGLLYLNDGQYEGKQIVPADWVHDSFQIYSENAWKIGVGRNWRDNGYGYQWWSIRAGDHRYNLAWGHGGQQIAVLKDLNMVIVVTVDPLHGQHGGGPWKLEKANLNLVSDFIASLPRE